MKAKYIGYHEFSSDEVKQYKIIKGYYLSLSGKSFNFYICFRLKNIYLFIYLC